MLRKPRRDRERATNVKQTLRILGDIAEVEFLDDDGCSAAIEAVHSKELAVYFDEEPTGMYKSDVCRLAQLAVLGGYYMDTDLEVLRDMRHILPPQTAFASIIALPWKGPKDPNEMFTAFIGVAPGHPVIRLALDMCLSYYQGRNKTIAAVLGESMRGTALMRMAYEDWAGHEMAGAAQVHTRDDRFKYSYLLEEERLDQKVYPNVTPQVGEGTNCNIVVVDRGQRAVVFFSHSIGPTTSCRPQFAGLSASRSIHEL